MTLSNRQVNYLIKPLTFLAALTPFAYLVYGAFTDGLGTNPVETMTHQTGEWGLRFLLITLAISPLRRLFGAAWLTKLRRMLGLFAFFYACLHFLTYIWLDQFFDFAEILHDIPQRPFITIGFVSFMLLIPLAITSTKKMQQRLKRNWKRLHQLIYVIPMLVVVHFIWSLKADYSEPFYYTLVFLVLMIERAYQARTQARTQARYQTRATNKKAPQF